MTALRYPSKITNKHPKKHNARERRVLETALESSRKDLVDTFSNFPKYSKTDGYSDPTGTTGDTNLMNTPQGAYEYHIKGTQTILSPAWTSGGLDIGMDQTDNDGVEITNGITARCAQAFVVGTDEPFFCEATITIADVSGTDDCAFGFRKAEAYQAAIDNYNDMAALNVILGAVKAETILANAATVTSGTLTSVVDTGTATLRIECNKAGQCKFFVNGTEYTGSVTPFAFTAGAVVVPFLYFLQATTSPTACTLTSWKVGRLYN